jgi:hypothetical protein
MVFFSSKMTLSTLTQRYNNTFLYLGTKNDSITLFFLLFAWKNTKLATHPAWAPVAPVRPCRALQTTIHVPILRRFEISQCPKLHWLQHCSRLTSLKALRADSTQERLGTCTRSRSSNLSVVATIIGSRTSAGY